MTRPFRLTFFSTLVLLFCAVFSGQLHAELLDKKSDGSTRASINYNFSLPLFNFNSPAIMNFHHFQPGEIGEPAIIPMPEDGGIKEIIPDKFKERYQRWKEELLSTESGRQQWASYADNKNFILTITMDGKEGQGAGTGKYQWDVQGTLVSATITLGNKLDKGLPDPIYFPVMSSLASDETSYTISGNILAATKFAHEFGHVNQTVKVKSDIFQLQNKLMPVYNEILLKNGYNIRDQHLIDLAKQMGGTPVEIWENREYWGEANAMLYLADRINRESYHCSVYNKMQRNLRLYAKDYEERFNQIAEEKNFNAACGK